MSNCVVERQFESALRGIGGGLNASVEILPTNGLPLAIALKTTEALGREEESVTGGKIAIDSGCVIGSGKDAEAKYDE